MTATMRRLIGTAGMAALLLGSAAWLSGAPATASGPAPIGAGADWRGINADSNETGYSRLAQVTPANAARLGLVWSLDLPGEASLEASPIAIAGRLYFTGAYATVYAVDGATGKLLWSFAPKTYEYNPLKMNFGFGANRGLAFADGRIFSCALDGRLIALDAATGKLIWQTDTTDPHGGQAITGAPRLFNGKVIIGQGGADFGMRGYVSAYDQATGKLLWKFYVVPGSPDQNAGDPAMEAAEKSWSPDFYKKTGGGGGPWDSITFDAALNRIYVGTANASPYDANSRSPGTGDNLYTASVVALDADTGKYVWHYQLNPRDSWDFDATQQMVLATLKIDGQPRDVLMQAPKNGFFYVLDRHTGKLISAGKIGKENWADHIDLATGRPVEFPDIRYETGRSVIYPASSGAHSWMRMAYSPATGLVYVPMMQLGTLYHRGEAADNEVNVGGLDVGTAFGEPGDGKGSLVAWDPVAARPRWTVPLSTVWNGGTAVTAGNIVFQGTADGNFSAYDATNGKLLWQRQLGMGIIAAPAVWSLGGRQYVSILAGYGGSAAILSEIMNVGWKFSSPRRLFTFALDGSAAMPDSPAPTMKINAQDNPAEKLDPAAVATGKALFMACAACHGRQAVGAGGPAPDLRESPIPLDPAAFATVVHDGALMSQGMPRFAMFDPQTIEGLRQYIRSQARKAIAP